MWKNSLIEIRTLTLTIVFAFVSTNKLSMEKIPQSKCLDTALSLYLLFYTADNFIIFLAQQILT